MSGPASRPALDAARLRQDFDRSFAEAGVLRSADRVDLLRIRVGQASLALRCSEIAGVFADRIVVPIPSSAPELLGLAGLRREIVPVYSLAALVGGPSTDDPRWLALAGCGASVAFAFDAFEGQARSAEPEAERASDPLAPAQHVSGIARLDGRLYPVLDVGSLVTHVRKRLPRNDLLEDR
jgi:purine-binding chemotaxis protein CheW